jgi:hypothetical protein
MDRQGSNALIRLAMGATLAYTVALPSITLYRILASPIDPGRAARAVPAFACLLVVELWLVVSAIRDRRGRPQLWGLADVPALSPAVEQLLAWTVREGVTNVLRHSQARTCSITAGGEGGAPAG